MSNLKKYDPRISTPLPTVLVVRLVERARRQLQDELRYVDHELDNVGILESWLGSRPGTISLPTPSAEPGDLLVKVGRAEFWTFTVQGWRELAPVERVFLGAGSEQMHAAYTEAGGQRRTFEEPDFGGGLNLREPDLLVEHGLERSGAAAERDFLAGPPDAVRAGWAERDVVGGQRAERDVIREEPHFGDRGARVKGLAAVAASMGPSAGMSREAPRVPPLLRAAEELRILADAIRRTIEVAERPDLGIDDRLTAFVEGLETARRIILEVPE